MNDGREPIGLDLVLRDVKQARQHIVVVDGHGRASDDALPAGDLAMAAASYLTHWAAFMRVVQEQNYMTEAQAREVLQLEEPPEFWPFERARWTPRNDRSDLVRAAALITAEIERLDRLVPERLQS